ncbi:MAG TPA: type II CAAX endopeptidase family protein [Candidatus Sulfotelmatobacter sp.]|jgi:membrane protease YdiL (CAAX protease family)|nr:type II CAAX endopeptidase family protein [Candidatus Sulfotelmatobacter sp.]
MDAAQSPRPVAFPGFWTAVGMTYLACWSQYAWSAVLGRWLPASAALGLALVLTFLLMAALALSSVGPDWRFRFGLAPFSRRFVPAIVLVVPVCLVTLGLQAAIISTLARGRSLGVWEWHGPVLSSSSDLGLLTGLFVVVVLMPVSLEIFFRGLMQQGLVARLGVRWGVLAASVFYAAAVAGVHTDVKTFSAVFWSTLVAGIVFGIMRQASGSLWAPAAAHVATSAVHAILKLAATVAPIPCISTPGRFVPAPIVGIAAACTAAGLGLVVWAARRPAD